MKSAIPFLALLLGGCGINPRHVVPIASTTSFTVYDCPQLEHKKEIVEHELGAYAGQHKHGTRHEVAVLLGDADAMNDEFVRKGCRIPPVKIPRGWKQRKF